MTKTVRALRKNELGEADRIFRLAFGTFIGLPDPMAFCAGQDYVNSRFHANPEGALALEIDGQFAGSNFVANWGSFGTFGPISVRPEYWNGGAAQAMLAPTMELFANWGANDAGLFTFSQSPKHLALYQKFDFWPRHLIGVMSKPLATREAAEPLVAASVADCRELTDSIFPGLDAAVEIRSVAAQNIGETVCIAGDRLDAYAICHYGPGSEAAPGACYIKFAAARPGAGIEQRFDRLLNACEAMAATRGLERLDAGVAMERSAAYRHLLDRGWRIARTAIAMHKGNRPAFNRPDVYVLDDWR